MHKKLEVELVILARSILQMKNKNDVATLHKKAQDITEKLFLLKFIDAYINSNPSSLKNEDEIINKSEPVFVDNSKEKEEGNSPFIKNDEKISVAVIKELFNDETDFIKEDFKDIPPLQNTLEEELKDALFSDVATQLFERATKENPVIEDSPENKQRSLNDTLFKNNLQIGLNDRIAFVKHLFEGNQEDFNRVLSQLNSFKTEKEAKNFINKMIKPDYNWSEKQEFELRLIDLIERKFL